MKIFVLWLVNCHCYNSNIQAYRHTLRCLDGLHLALITDAVYVYVVTDFGNYTALITVEWCVTRSYHSSVDAHCGLFIGGSLYVYYCHWQGICHPFGVTHDRILGNRPDLCNKRLHCSRVCP